MGSEAQGQGLALNSREGTSSSETGGIFYSNLLTQAKLWKLRNRSASSEPVSKILLLGSELAEIVI